MDGSKKVERVSKANRQLRWTQHHFVRCTDIESAMEYEDSIEPNQRYVGNVETAKPADRKRALVRGMGKEARETQRELLELRGRSNPRDD